MTRARDLANIADGTFTATDLNLSGTLDVSGDATFDTNTLFVDVSANNVGIGTTSPAQKLDVSSAGTTRIQVKNTNLTSSGLYVAEDSTGAQFNELGAYPMRFHTSGTERMRIDSSGNVGIGTTSPSAPFHANVSGTLPSIAGSTVGLFSRSANCDVSIIAGSTHLARVNFGDNSSETVGQLAYSNGNNSMRFTTNSAEAMRIDSSGNLLVGKTATGLATVGTQIQTAGGVYSTVASERAFIGNRTTSDGSIIELRKDNATIGSIGSIASDLFIAESNSGLRFDGENNQILPSSTTASTDGTCNLGAGSARFKDIYATNGTIQTSDANEKQDVAELNEAERRVAVAAKGLLRKFRWIDSVEAKGDEARIHFGIIAQDLQAAFEAEGLDAGRYAMFIHSTWTDEETGEERSRMGVRYSELLAFIIAAL